MLQILKERIFPLHARPRSVWNTYPGALLNLSPLTPKKSPSSSSSSSSAQFPSLTIDSNMASDNEVVAISSLGTLTHRHDNASTRNVGFTAVISSPSPSSDADYLMDLSTSPTAKALATCTSLKTVSAKYHGTIDFTIIYNIILL